MTDLTALDLRVATAEGAPVDLLHPGTGKSLGVTLTVQGYDSEAVDTAARDVQRAAMKAKAKRETADLMREVRVAKAQAALMDVKGATGSTTTVEQYRALMAQPGYVWVIEQIEAVAGDRASFFRSAETP